MTSIPACVVPENRYDLLTAAPAIWSPTAAVVVPAYGQVVRLARTLEGLARQSIPPNEVVVADDGSDPPIEHSLNPPAGLDVTFVRQERDGFGAGRARNAGAAVVTSDVIIFLDADCIPRGDLVARHVSWHAKGRGLVVLGHRANVVDSDGARATTDEELERAASSLPAELSPSGWRDELYRRTKHLRIGDSGFRGLVSANFSVDRRLFESVGGFDETFRAWGGEDTELGWRLWNAGATFVVDQRAMAFHQVGIDETRAARALARRPPPELLADRMPHRFYRSEPSGAYSVPWISVVRRGRDLGQLPGFELGHSDAEVLDATPESVMSQLGRTRGEFVVLVDHRVEMDDEFVDSAIRHLRRNPRVGVVRSPVRQDASGPLTSVRALVALDTRESLDGLPLIAVVRRREIGKELLVDGVVDWARVAERNRTVVAATTASMYRGDGSSSVSEGVITRSGATFKRGANSIEAQVRVLWSKILKRTSRQR